LLRCSSVLHLLDNLPKPLGRVWGTEARHRQWRMKAGGTSENGKERLRDYSVSRIAAPTFPHREAIKEKAVRERSDT
ncbi:MAG: hypothetical protein ACI4MU_06805, partial [Candidatus Ventricola sp.]